MKRSKKFLFALTPLLGLLTCGELSSRVIGMPECQPIQPQTGSWETMIPDPDLLWKLEPNRRFETGNNVTQINAVGLRDSLLPSKKKKDNEIRVMLTGDSSIYGWGVKDNETYAIYLEQNLRKHFRRSIEVINLGVPGYSTEQTLLLLNQIW
jgi:hypothetical protein